MLSSMSIVVHRFVCFVISSRDLTADKFIYRAVASSWPNVRLFTC